MVIIAMAKRIKERGRGGVGWGQVQFQISQGKQNHPCYSIWFTCNPIRFIVKVIRNLRNGSTDIIHLPLPLMNSLPILILISFLSSDYLFQKHKSNFISSHWS